MRTIEATYRITTPMFCSGADQTRAELRLPSFKGVLRFWWRAMSFGRLGASLAELARAESALFGSAHGGQSRVLLRLDAPQLGGGALGEQPHFRPGTWEGYVGYGLTDAKARPRRQFVRPGTTFTVRVIGPRLDADDWARLRTAMILLGMFGGMGGRSRKGWGSLTVQRLNDGGEVWAVPSSRERVREAVRQLLPKHPAQPALPPFTAFGPSVRIAVGPEHQSADHAHKWLAERYREAVRPEPETSGSSKSEREQFGLPRAGAGRNALMRRASPVFLHVHQAEAGNAIPVASFLPARFLEWQAEPIGGWHRVQALLDAVETA